MPWPVKSLVQKVTNGRFFGLVSKTSIDSEPMPTGLLRTGPRAGEEALEDCRKVFRKVPKNKKALPRSLRNAHRNQRANLELLRVIPGSLSPPTSSPRFQTSRPFRKAAEDPDLGNLQVFESVLRLALAEERIHPLDHCFMPGGEIAAVLPGDRNTGSSAPLKSGCSSFFEGFIKTSLRSKGKRGGEFQK